MKNKKPKTTKEILLTLLRKKQSKGIMPYLTTKDTPYKVFRWLFFVALVICIGINLIYILGTLGRISATLAYKSSPTGTEIQAHQQIEISYMYTSVNIMVVATLGLFLSEVFVWFKLPLLQLISCVASSITIISRMSAELAYFSKSDDLTSNTLTQNQKIPLAFLCFFCLVSSIIHLRQLYKDKKGCEAISEIIYKNSGALAKDISPDEWDNILEEFDPQKTNSKKRSVKDRLKKQNKKQEKENVSKNAEE